VGLRSATTADKKFQHLKAQLVITKSVQVKNGGR